LNVRANSAARWNPANGCLACAHAKSPESGIVRNILCNTKNSTAFAVGKTPLWER
jgi:hypothetical protein